MAVVFRQTSNVEKNADGLVVLYHKAQGVADKSGVYVNTAGDRHILEAIISLPGLPTVASGNKQIQSNTVTVPNGAFIEMVRVVVLKETTGVNANLNVGLVDQDCSTEIDFDGFLAAADAFNGGTDLGTVTDFTVGTTEAGALIGTKITNTGLITAHADTADFTAGVVKVQVFYSIPLSGDL
jgi:hypothetical protein